MPGGGPRASWNWKHKLHNGPHSTVEQKSETNAGNTSSVCTRMLCDVDVDVMLVFWLRCPALPCAATARRKSRRVYTVWTIMVSMVLAGTGWSSHLWVPCPKATNGRAAWTGAQPIEHRLSPARPPLVTLADERQANHGRCGL